MSKIINFQDKVMPTHLNLAETSSIERILAKAGKISLEHFRSVQAKTKPDGSSISRADYLVQDCIIDELSTLFPDDGFIAEENNILINPSKKGSRYWVIDPIDGTNSYVNEYPTWGISLGLVEENKPYAGFFLMPATGDFFSVSGPCEPFIRTSLDFSSIFDEASTRNTEVVRTWNRNILNPLKAKSLGKNSLLLTSSTFHQNYTLRQSFKGRVKNLGSISAHFAYVASGRADVALIREVKIWDLISGWAMLESNGGKIEYLDKRLELNMESLLKGNMTKGPILIGHQSVIDEFRSMIEYRSQTTIEPLNSYRSKPNQIFTMQAG